MSLQEDGAPRGRPGAGELLARQVQAEERRRDKSGDLKPLSRLAPYVARHAGDAFLAGVFLVLSSSSTLGLTVAARYLVDHVFGDLAGAGATLSPAQVAELNRWFLVLGGVAVALALATALRYLYVTRLGERVVADLRKDLYAKVMALDPAYFLKVRTGEVLSRVTTDIQLLDTLLSSSVSMALRNALTLIGALVLMLVVSPHLTGLALLLLPVVIAPLAVLGRSIRRLTVKSQDRFAEAIGMAGESLDALETVQAFGREKSAVRRFGDAVEGAFQASMTRVRARSFMTALFIVLTFGGIVGVLWLGARSVLTGDMSGGALIQFVFLSVLAAGAVGGLGETWGDVQKAAGAMHRVEELNRAQPLVAPPARPIPLPVPPRGEAAFENVTFAYPGRPDLPALNGFTLHVRPGERVALVGPSGAGKSTVFRLLLRFYDPQTGSVRVDGVDLREADPREVRARTALVAQDSPLFSGSATDNIRFGREEATLDEIREAAAEAQASAFVEALPGGFDAALGERARSLSGGQRQRLAIARALIREAPILLLDEATSALDAENERLVQTALDRAMQGRTTIVIAHRLATVLSADRIVVMDEGRVVEQGTHGELVARGGLYARLAELQFQAAA